MPIREAVGLRQDFRSSTAHREILDVDRWSRGGARRGLLETTKEDADDDDGSPADGLDPLALHPVRQSHALRRDAVLKVVEYVHLDLAGESSVEEREVVSETIESVRCRWCNAVDQIELVDRPGAAS